MLSPRNLNVQRNQFDNMATPMFKNMSQIPASFRCISCGPINFTMQVNGEEKCGECGEKAISIQATSRKIAPRTVKLTTRNNIITTNNNENKAVFASDDVTPSVLSKQQPIQAKSSRRRRLFGKSSTPIITLSTTTPMPESKGPSTTASTTQRNRLFATPTIFIPTEDEHTSPPRSPVCSIRVGVKLHGRSLLVRACRPPMTNGFYRISVTDVQTGNESEFISCAKERPAFAAWPEVDFVALLSNHYASSPKRAPFPYQQYGSKDKEQKETTEIEFNNNKENDTVVAMPETTTTSQSPLLSTLQITTLEQQKTVERTRPNRRPPSTPSVAAATAATAASESKIKALELQLQHEQSTRKDCEERLSIVIEHSEHRLSTLLSEQEQHNQTLNQVKNTAELTKTTLEQQIKDSVQEMNTFKQQMKCDTEEFQTKLNATVAEKELKCNVLEENIMKANEKIKNMTLELSTNSETDAQMMKSNQFNLDQMKFNFETSKTRHLSECSVFTKNIDALTLENKEMVLKNEELNQKVAEQQHLEKKKFQEMEDITNQLKTINVLKNTCDQKNIDMKNQITVLSQKLDVVTQNHINEQSNTTAMQSNLESIQLNLTKSMNRETILKNEFEAFKTSTTTDSTECMQLMNENETLQQKISALKIEKNEILEDFGEATVNYKTYERKTEKINMDLEIAKDKIEKSNAFMLETKKENERNVQSLTHVWENKIVEMKQTWRMEAQQQLDDAIQTCKTEAIAEHNTFTSELFELKKNYENISNSLIREQNMNVTINVELQKNTTLLNTSTTKVDALELELNEKKTNVHTVETKMAEMKQNMVLFENKMTVAEETITNLKEKLQVSEHSFNELQNKTNEEIKRKTELELNASTNPNYPKYSTTEYEEYGKQQLQLGTVKGKEENVVNEDFSKKNMIELRIQHTIEIETLEKKNDLAMQNITKEHESTKSELEKLKADTEINNADVLQYCENMTKENTALKQTSETKCKATEIKCEEKLNSLTSKNKTLNTLVASHNSKMKDKEQQLVVLLAQRESWNIKEKEYKEQENYVKGELESAKEQSVTFDQTCSNYEREKKSVDQELKKTKYQLKKAVKSEEAAKLELTENMERVKKIGKDKAHKFKESELHIKKLKDRCQKLVTKIKELTEQLEKETSSAKANNMKKAEDITAKKNEVGRLTIKLEEAMRLKATADQQVLSLTSENANLETSQYAMNNANLQWKEEREFLMQNLEALMEELETARAAVTEKEKEGEAQGEKATTVLDDCETF